MPDRFDLFPISARFHEGDKIIVLEDFDFFPYVARNRQRKELRDVPAQAFHLDDQLIAHCIKHAAHMKNDEHDENPLGVGNRLLGRVRRCVTHPRQSFVVEKHFPDFPVAGGDGKQIAEAFSSRLPCWTCHGPPHRLARFAAKAACVFLPPGHYPEPRRKRISNPRRKPALTVEP